jgi:hypothetical protein
MDVEGSDSKDVNIEPKAVGKKPGELYSDWHAQAE